MRMHRFSQYAAYVMVMSLLSSVIVLLQVGQSAANGGSLNSRNTMMFLPMVLTIVPYAMLQAGIAAAVVKPLSLRWLFLLSAALLLVGNLLPAFTMQMGPKWIRWASLMVYTFASNRLAWLLPVLILALAGRRRAAHKQVSASGAEPTVTADATTPQEGRVAQGEKSTSRWYGRDIGSGVLRRWYYWDIGLAVLPVWFGIILDPVGLLGYLGGLINVPISLLAGMFSIMLVPAVPLCLVALLVRMLVVWPRHIHGFRRLLLAWGAFLAAVAILFILPFVARRLSPRDTFMAGFTRYVQGRADIPAVQAWLDTLDRASMADPKRQSGVANEANLPQCVRRLKAWHTMATLDDKGRPMIRLMWGSGMMGSWGLVVGHQEMETPPSDFARYGEYRTSVAPGAYVWREIQ